MKKLIVILLGAVACSQPPRSTVAIPARFAMDSIQIERTCAQPGLVRVGLAECELKDQAPRIPMDLRSFP